MSASENRTEPRAPRFYEALQARLERPARRLDLYSISACFGFYSQGMKVFADVLRALRTAVKTPEPFGVRQLRILLKADDHLIDTFGVERFHGFLEDPGVVIREMARPESLDDWIQFAVFDEKEVIYTTSQRGFRDEALDLGINQLSEAHIADVASGPSIVQQHVDLFSEAWKRSVRFEIPRMPSMDELVQRLEKSFPVRAKPNMSEEEYEEQLEVLLHGMYDPALIRRQYPIGDHVLDLAIGDPKRRLVAIEVKLASNEEKALKAWKGQVASYREVVREVLLVVIGEGISPQKLHDLQEHFETDDGVRVIHRR